MVIILKIIYDDLIHENQSLKLVNSESCISQLRNIVWYILDGHCLI